MNQTRGTSVPTRPDEVDQPVVVRSHPYPDANAHGAHSHRKAQLVWSHDGVVTVDTHAGRWVAPPQWAVWVTSRLEHDVQATGQWRTHARLRAALALLASGHSVGVTARAVGYSNQSAFTASFRRVLGTTPARYFSTD